MTRSSRVGARAAKLMSLLAASLDQQAALRQQATRIEHVPRNLSKLVGDVDVGNPAFRWPCFRYGRSEQLELRMDRRCRAIVVVTSKEKNTISPDDEVTFTAGITPHGWVERQRRRRVPVEAPCLACASIKVDG